MKHSKLIHHSPTPTRWMLSLIAASVLMGCNSDEPETISINTPHSSTTPQEVELDPVVVLPSAEDAPSADEIVLSAINDVDATSTSADQWLIVCDDQTSIAPSTDDSFGALWKLSRQQIDACGTAEINKNGQSFGSPVTFDQQDFGHSFYLTSTGSPSSGTRQDGYLAAIGLPQDDTDIILPSVTAPDELPAGSANQVALQLYDPMGDYAPYDDFSLHLWGTVQQPDGGCSGLEQANSNWDDQSVTPDAMDQFGPVWYLPVTSNEEGCFNVIFRDNNNSKLIGDDVKIDIANLASNLSATFMPNNSTQFASRSEAFQLAGPSSEFVIDTHGALLIDDQTLVWHAAKNADVVQIMFSNNGEFQTTQEETDDGSTTTVSGASIVLTAATLTSEQASQYPHLVNHPVFALPTLPDTMSLDKLLKANLVAVASDSDGTMRSATGIQTAGALDAIYAPQASQLDYGAVYQDNAVTFRLWAPTAQKVSLSLYNSDKTPDSSHEMTEDSASGSWSVTLDQDLVDGQFYRYQMSLFQPREQQGYQFEVTDPYSVSLAMNSEYSQAINLDSEQLKPSGWDALEVPHSQAESDLSKVVIYESHVRDFSALDDSTENKGKYLAFTEQQSVPVNHLHKLKAAGVTHLHLMPVFDIATINEDPQQVANIDQPFSQLCSVNPNVQQSQFSGYCSQDVTIAEVFEQLSEQDSKDNAVVEALNEYVRGVDSYNWGYDPFHYTVPEGSYATNSDGADRIIEFRQMVQSIKQDIGMNVVVDVVYNHTNASGLTSDKSVLDRIVPLYYHRLVPDTGAVETSTCCDNTAPEHAMFAKLIDDSIKVWTEQYKIDAFRWDLMGHHPLSQMVTTLEAARTVNPEVYFYGEGWNFGEVQDDARFIQATQKHLGGTGIGSFSDRLRDAVRGGSPFESGDDIRRAQGFATGAYVAANELMQDALTTDQDDDGVADELARALHQSDLIRLGMAGNLKSFQLVDHQGTSQTGATLDYNGQSAGYAEQPWEVQNYVSKHDNQTFWDINMYKVAHDISLDDRVRMQAVGMSTVLLGQAMPFNHMGGELLRSKSMQRDSYDFGDWYNRVDFSLQDNNWDKGLPAKEKDEANYELIEKVLTQQADPQATQIEQMFDFYQELLQVRTSTALLTLPDAQQILSRVDFRNTGPEQTAGLIVMTIDNGNTQETDIDSRYNSVVVMINATPETQTATHFIDHNGDPITLGDFELIETHADTRSIAGSASFADGKFSVPAWSAAVFVEPRSDTRGQGLPVSSKADIPPFGASQAIYIAGDFNGWTVDGTLAAYAGDGVYQQRVGLSDDSEFKFTFGHWDTAFGCGGGNCNAGFTSLGMYLLTMDANDTSNPEISASLVEDYSNTTWYLPGSLLGWQHSDAQKMLQESSTTWSAQFDNMTAGSTAEFKITGESWGVFEHGSQDIVSQDARISGDGNITFTADTDGSFKITFNIVTKALSVTSL
ncbi:pullulanase-type alpha-1,6-glucosidase [Vibrio hippocampi]|uniref:Glycogen debranching enzyme n=1 Tax=Vibrio hippocampi TaxID=654686 RepID=A0ABN8DIK7_9VIBR|nr:pullulanase-type alpha-1,6-glucosidase [Vibrio hippocampi]CAH0526355.1 Glycogen debranching enzyme [Vibrio hippocampi]